jgi:predicted RNA-binding Zn-ribbon protein involved in translation (DUF1610 family)
MLHRQPPPDRIQSTQPCGGTPSGRLPGPQLPPSLQARGFPHDFLNAPFFEHLAALSAFRGFRLVRILTNWWKSSRWTLIFLPPVALGSLVPESGGRHPSMTGVAHMVKFQCPNCGYELEQTIGRIKSSEHMNCAGCGVGINIDVNRLSRAAAEIQKAIEKVPPEITIKFYR